VSISGAVRKPIKHFWSENGKMTVADLVNLGGGLKAGSADFGYLIHTDIKDHKKSTYALINIRKAVNNPSSAENLILQRGDQVHVFASSTFSDSYTVRMIGAVRNEIEVKYSKDMGIRDLVLLAGGLKEEAASNRIDIYRLVFQNNEASQTLVQTVAIDANFNPLDANVKIDIQPRDVIAVRYVPEFEPMKLVQLNGEVRFPGTYALITNNESLYDLIARAGGLTVEAFSNGAKLQRSSDVEGYMILDLKKALKNRNSKANLKLKAGDVIEIPKIMDYVSIKASGTNAAGNFPKELLNDGTLHLTYAGRNSARWYIKNYAGGFSKQAMRRKTQVVRANGQI
jgi:protein involved in polysaccharide export with SLBB domain